MNICKILIADKQELIVESLSTLINQQPDMELIDAVTSHYFVQQLLETYTINVLITDPSTMDFVGIEQLTKLQQQYTMLSVMVVTNTLNKRDVLELTKAGIKVILTKHCSKQDVLSGIEAAVRVKKYYSPEVLDLLTSVEEPIRNAQDEQGQLTATEIEIVRMISQGLTTKEIAQRKHSSFHTVMTHRKNIFRKLDINNASELVIYAIKTGLIEPMEYYI